MSQSSKDYILDTFDFTYNFTKPSTLKSQLQTLESQLQSVLQNFINNYVANYSNPGNQEYESNYESAKNSLNGLNTQLFNIANETETNSYELNKKLTDLDEMIKKEKEENKMLKKKLGQVDSNMNASEELIEDYQQLYDSEYLRNWGLFLSILIALFALSTMYNLSSFIIISIFVVDVFLILLFVLSKMYNLSVYFIGFMFLVIIMVVLLVAMIAKNVYGKMNSMT